MEALETGYRLEKCQKALAYMEEKYNRKFYPEAWEEKDLLSDKDTLYVHAEGIELEQEKISVFIYGKEDNLRYEDNYFGVLVKEDYQERVKEIFLQQFFSKVSVYIENFIASSFDASLDENSNLEDAYEAGEKMGAYLYVYVEATQEELDYFENKCDIIAEDLAAHKLSGFLNVFAVEEGTLDKVTSENYDSFLEDYFEPDGIVCKKIVRKAVKFQA